ncbi:hypothetical protein BMW24_007180 [Mycobacterium heckeshornense]|uniref:Uncharacterized protein n=1 Tax=Mycobacterium heckeshornense TaxID=110505 RepID=A0A2G8BCY2_9MYCO|nr:hypothetical protein ACT16_21575 [Mycobacterium heckeshornense]PIJ35584.1 hypothetical protein BMW24_007180 [Mycobacterium heckeshornense]BCO35701.1 hypothetical protein MHEC_21340 [Mycobacterium heckeshornense]
MLGALAFIGSHLRLTRPNQFALLASQGVPPAFGSDATVAGEDPWAAARAAAGHCTPGSAVSLRAVLAPGTPLWRGRQTVGRGAVSCG